MPHVIPYSGDPRGGLSRRRAATRDTPLHANHAEAYFGNLPIDSNPRRQGEPMRVRRTRRAAAGRGSPRALRPGLPRQAGARPPRGLRPPSRSDGAHRTADAALARMTEPSRAAPARGASTAEHPAGLIKALTQPLTAQPQAKVRSYIFGLLRDIRRASAGDGRGDLVADPGPRVRHPPEDLPDLSASFMSSDRSEGDLGVRVARGPPGSGGWRGGVMSQG